MRSKSVWSVILLAICCLLAMANGQCSWKLHQGGEEIDPFDAAEGSYKYVVSTKGKEGLKDITNELRKIQAVSPEDVNSIRELTALGNIVTAKMSKRAFIWLCRQEELDSYIKFVEIDQQVSLFTGPVAPSQMAVPPVMLI